MSKRQEERRALVEDFLGKYQIERCCQRCPWTYVEVSLIYDGKRYYDFGNSKVCWPDKWDSAHGIDIAVRRALTSIAKNILEPEREHFFDLGQIRKPDVEYQAQLA
jgi:hypothetical protein